MPTPATMPSDSNRFLDNVILNGLREARHDPAAGSLAVIPTPTNYIPFRLHPALVGDGDIPLPPGTSAADVAAVRSALQARGYITIPQPPAAQPEQQELF